MNRFLLVPGLLCVVGFVALGISLQRARGWEQPIKTSLASDNQLSVRNASVPGKPGPSHITVEESRHLLAALGQEYRRAWKQLENSPSRLYSRAAPRPLPSLSLDIDFAATEPVEESCLCLGTMLVKKGTNTEALPCAVDRSTQQTFVFVAKKWMTGSDWVKSIGRP